MSMIARSIGCGLIAVITSADPDHLDIYGTEAGLSRKFEHYTSLIRKGIPDMEGGTGDAHTDDGENFTY